MADVILLVSGSRSIERHHWCYNCIEYALNIQDIKTSNIKLLLNGGAEGVDQSAREWAMDKETIPIKLFKPDWNTYGNHAGFICNNEMVKWATHVIAIWDGESSGTEHVIKLATEANKLIGTFDCPFS